MNKNKSTNSSSKSVPNFPQHNLPEPFLKLQTLGYGDHVEVYEKTVKQILAGDAHKGAETLLKMILDETYYDYDTEEYEEGEGGDARGWTPYNALRILGRLGKAGEIGIIPLMPLLAGEDEYIVDELPFYFAFVGESALEPLISALLDEKNDAWLRAGVAESISEIAQKHPQLRDKSIVAFEKALDSSKDDRETMSAIIVALLDIKATELYPQIEEAFLNDQVDEFIVQLADVQEHFGMEVTAVRADKDDFSDDDGGWDPEFSKEDWEAAKADVLAGRGEEYPGKLNTEAPPQTPFVGEAKPGRNEPCSCGSGKKYKKCCGG